MILGTPERTQLLICIVTMAWLIMGFGMAFHKAQMGPKVGWNGYEIEDTPASTFVKVKTEFMNELWKESRDIMNNHAIGLEFLRSFTGRVNHASNLMWVWRPFLDVLWADTAGKYSTLKGGGLKPDKRRTAKKCKAPTGMIWVKQLKQSLLWIRAFLNSHDGPLRRE